MSEHTLLQVRNLNVSFFTHAGDVQAVRGVSWHVREKETIAIVGESGCGKTVSIQTVMGLLTSPGRIVDGEIIFKGENLVGAPRESIRRLQGNEMSMIFQDPLTYLNPTMRVGEQIAEAYRRHNTSTRAEARSHVLDMMKLISFPEPEQNMRRYPFQLSGGMRQRIMVAMALICGPSVLFADEPTTALDVTIQAQIIELMNSLKHRLDAAIVLITHDLGVVANMAQRIYVMYAGRIVEYGDARTIFRNPKHPYTWGLLHSVPRIDSEKKEHLQFIPGTPPDLIAPPPGCPFAPRCRFAMNICADQPPTDFTFEEPGREPSAQPLSGHYASCWLYREDAQIAYADIIERKGSDYA